MVNPRLRHRQLGHEHDGHYWPHPGHTAQQFGLGLPDGVVLQFPVQRLRFRPQPVQVDPQESAEVG